MNSTTVCDLLDQAKKVAQEKPGTTIEDCLLIAGITDPALAEAALRYISAEIRNRWKGRGAPAEGTIEWFEKRRPYPDPEDASRILEDALKQASWEQHQVDRVVALRERFLALCKEGRFLTLREEGRRPGSEDRATRLLNDLLALLRSALPAELVTTELAGAMLQTIEAYLTEEKEAGNA